jgi:hypothetical protein
MRIHEITETTELPTGAYIFRDGTIEDCDHHSGHHHAHIALSHFDIRDDNDGEDYDLDSAENIAIKAADQEGWIRISASEYGLGVSWKIPPTGNQIKALDGLMTEYLTHPFPDYMIECNPSFFQTDDPTEFLKTLRIRLRSRMT